MPNLAGGFVRSQNGESGIDCCNSEKIIARYPYLLVVDMKHVKSDDDILVLPIKKITDQAEDVVAKILLLYLCLDRPLQAVF